MEGSVLSWGSSWHQESFHCGVLAFTLGCPHLPLKGLGVCEPRHLSVVIQVTEEIRNPGVRKEETKRKEGGGGRVRICLIWEMEEREQEGGWQIPGPFSSPLFQSCLLWLSGLADFKHHWGIPGRQKNSGPRLGSQSKITCVFISGRALAGAWVMCSLLGRPGQKS